MEKAEERKLAQKILLKHKYDHPLNSGLIDAMLEFASQPKDQPKEGKSKCKHEFDIDGEYNTRCIKCGYLPSIPSLKEGKITQNEKQGALRLLQEASEILEPYFKSARKREKNKKQYAYWGIRRQVLQDIINESDRHSPLSKTLDVKPMPIDLCEKYETSLKVLRTMLNKAGLTLGVETTDSLLKELKDIKTSYRESLDVQELVKWVDERIILIQKEIDKRTNKELELKTWQESDKAIYEFIKAKIVSLSSQTKTNKP